MSKLKAAIKKNYIAMTYLAFYCVVSLLLLTKFPVMHSDESWLSGLTRTMMHEGLGATEYFFDLIPRYPHAIKSIFHMIQMPFILVFGYNLFSVRLVSLLFGIISLVLLYKIIVKLTDSKLYATLGMIVVSLDIQFMYASHFARQEIIIVSAILMGIYYIISNIDHWSIKRDIITGSIIGLSIGIHPNSFLVALILGSVYLYYILFNKKLNLKNLTVLILVTAAFAALFIGLSFLLNDNFISDYLKYGDDLGTTSSGIMKLFAFPKYYNKLYDAFSVTYYTPQIKLQFVLFALGIAGGFISLIFGKEKSKALLFILPIIALNVGYITIGRYSQPGIVLLFPLCYLLMFLVINRLKKLRVILAAVLCLLIGANTFIQLPVQTNNDYKEYISEIQSIVPADSIVLANLNTEYAFDFDKLYDYRNLDKLEDQKFSQYIEDNQIEYIIYPEEMDYIYNNRPVWNVMYGNVFPYYEDMSKFLSEDCQLIDEFSSPYAMRILMYSRDKEWSVKIYQVLEDTHE